MNEDKATRYHRLRRRASIISLAWGLVLLAALLATGASRVLSDLAASLALATSLPPACQPSLAVALYVLLLAALHEIVALPLGFYSGYQLERRYNLSTERAGQWFKEHVKASLVGLVLGLAGLTLLYFAIARWPVWWWAAAGTGFSVVTIILANLGPVLLLPLFYHLTPLDRPHLREHLLQLAAGAGVRAAGIFRWALSARTRKANAALTGLGATRRILLSDTLLDEYSDDEIAVIIAHELAHQVHRDIWRGVAYETVLAFGGFYLAARLLDGFGRLAGVRSAADVAGLPLLLLSAGAVSLLLMPLANALSRSHERRADRFALDATGDPAAFISAMRRLAAQNLAEQRPSRLVRALFYTHPPVEERIEMAEGWKASAIADGR
jgi:STE24 endopeptidase